MFLSTSQIEMMSRDELWCVAANRKTVRSIRRAALRQWLTLESSNVPRNEIAERARLRATNNNGHPA